MKFKFINHEYDLPELESKGRYWNKILRVTSGCTPCSPGCDHCHEAAREHRWRPGLPLTTHDENGTRFAGEIEIRPIHKVEKKCLVKKPTVYFVWNDLFHPLVSEDYILAVMLAMSQSRRNGGPHIYLLCTKRVGRMAELLNKWCKDYLTFHEGCTGRIPSHIWPMGTFCNQAEFDAGIGDLLSINASVRVLNLEPLLGSIDIIESIGYNPVDESDKQGDSSLYGNQSGLVRNQGRRLSLEDRPETKEQMGRDGHGKTGNTEADRCICRCGIPQCEANGRRDSSVVSGASPGMVALQRADTGKISNQPHQRGQSGQPSGKSGIGDPVREYETCLPDRVDGRTRGKESSSQVKRFRSGDDSDRICDGQHNANGDCGKIRGCIPDNIKDCQRGSPEPSAGGDSRLHIQPPKNSTNERCQGPLSLIIIGGETGPGARPAHPSWFRSLRDQCKASGTPFLFKNWGAWSPDMPTVTAKNHGRLLDGRMHNEYPEVSNEQR